MKKTEVLTDSAQLKLTGNSFILSGVGHPLSSGIMEMGKCVQKSNTNGRRINQLLYKKL